MTSLNTKITLLTIVSFFLGASFLRAQIQIDNTVTGTQLANSIMAPTNQIVAVSCRNKFRLEEREKVQLR